MTYLVAVIPARGGSKRIPRKNIRNFLGKPLLAYSIDAARRAAVFDHIIVSTDDEEIANVARSCGAEVPFIRPASLADDYTTTAAVICHAIAKLQQSSITPDYVACIYPTAPMLQAEDLRRGLAALQARADKSFALAVTSFPFPVQRAIRINQDGAIDALYPQYRDTRSQDLEAAYHDAGQFCWGRTEAWLRGDIIFSAATLPVLLPRYRVQDIDNPEDWQRAECLLASLRASGDVAA
ncbi:pseudaminic acid cytidylyltransferase [Chitinimonas sp.]|uniref:pseudaminic acid cytidylyltransferase n=1 Tax=Chitinimonas sp. TaxID=1934313 RepID=UPI0035B0CBCA